MEIPVYSPAEGQFGLFPLFGNHRFMYRFLYEHKVSFLQGEYLEMEFLDQMVKCMFNFKLVQFWGERVFVSQR